MSKFVAGIYFFYETKKIYKKINIPSILKRMMVDFTLRFIKRYINIIYYVVTWFIIEETIILSHTLYYIFKYDIWWLNVIETKINDYKDGENIDWHLVGLPPRSCRSAKLQTDLATSDAGLKRLFFSAFSVSGVLL